MAENKLLAPIEDYLNSGVHVGTRFKTKAMKKFIFKSRTDRLKVIDTEVIDKRINLMINLVSNYEPSEIAVFGRRENAKKPIKVFGKLIKCDTYPGRYYPGSLTNTELKNFKEYKLIIISDPLADKNILKEAFIQGITIVALCDTNNETSMIDLVVPINNKGKKSLALLYYLLAKHYLDKKGILKKESFKYKLSDFYDE